MILQSLTKKLEFKVFDILAAGILEYRLFPLFLPKPKIVSGTNNDAFEKRSQDLSFILE